MVLLYMLTWGILMVNVTIYSIHGSYGYGSRWIFQSMEPDICELRGVTWCYWRVTYDIQVISIYYPAGWGPLVRSWFINHYNPH